METRAAAPPDSDDYSPSTGCVTFSPGETYASAGPSIGDDSLYEGTEDFVISLDSSNPVVDPNHDECAVTIYDNESSPTVGVSSASCNEGDGSVGVELTLSVPTELGWSVAWCTSDGSAEAGSDYTAASGTAYFAPSATLASVSVAITDDPVAEDNETFSVSVTQESGSSGAFPFLRTYVA